MFIPDIISTNILSVYHSNYTPKTKRVLNCQDFDNFVKTQVKTLRKQCLDTIITDWADIRMINELTLDEDARYILDNLPLDLSFELSTFYIHDELYWRRAFKKRWPGKILPTKPVKIDYDIPNQFDRTMDGDMELLDVVKINTWKCFYIERHFQDFLENLKPENYHPQQMKELIELSRDYIIRLKLNQLQAPTDANKERIPLHVILPALTNLKQLNICFKQNYVGDHFSWHVVQTTNKDIKNLSKGLQQCQLNVLRIINTDITCDKVTIIACHLVGNKNLQVLDFSHCKIGDKGTIAICNLLRELPDLEELNLQNNFIEDKGLEFLCYTLSKNCNLKQLDLNLNTFGNSGADFLSRLLIENTKLRKLNLSACGLTANNVELLIKSLQTNTSLLSLDLSNNRLNENIGHMFVDLLKLNYTLTTLDLRMTWIPSNIVLEIENILHDFDRKLLQKVMLSPKKKVIEKIFTYKMHNESNKKTGNDNNQEFPMFCNVHDMELQIQNVFQFINKLKDVSSNIETAVKHNCENMEENIQEDKTA